MSLLKVLRHSTAYGIEDGDLRNEKIRDKAENWPREPLVGDKGERGGGEKVEKVGDRFTPTLASEAIQGVERGDEGTSNVQLTNSRFAAGTPRMPTGDDPFIKFLSGVVDEGSTSKVQLHWIVSGMRSFSQTSHSVRGLQR